MKYYDITKLENKNLNVIHYKIIYINTTTNEPLSLSTVNSWLAIFQYIYFKTISKCGYNVQIFRNDKDITEKVNKMIEKL